MSYPINSDQTGGLGCSAGKPVKCLGTGASNAIIQTLVEPKKVIEDIRGYITNAASKFVSVIKDRGMCMTFFAKEIPEMIPNMVGSVIDKTISGVDRFGDAIQGVTDKIEGLFVSLSNKEIKGYPNIFGPVEVLIAIVVIKIQKLINTLILGPNADKIVNDPNMDSDKLWASINATGDMYKKISMDPEFKEKFSAAMLKFSETLLSGMNVARPQIDMVTSKLTDIIKNAAEKGSDALQFSLRGIMNGILLAIPGVGTVLSIILAGENVAKALIGKCGDVAAKGAGKIMPVADLINKVVVNSTNELKCIGDSMSGVIQKYTPKMQGVNKQSGGRIYKGIDSYDMYAKTKNAKKRIKLQINKTHRRILFLLNSHTRKKK